MELDLENEFADRAYQILASLVTPRPIALVTTISADGKVNAAPFSFFNIMGANRWIRAHDVEEAERRGVHFSTSWARIHRFAPSRPATVTTARQKTPRSMSAPCMSLSSISWTNPSPRR